MSDQTGSLTLEDVRKRFAESEEALQQIRGRLVGLADAQANAQASADSLREAAGVITGFGTKAAQLLEELAGAQHDARAALDATARFLDGSELSAIRESIEGLRGALVERLDSIDTRQTSDEAELHRTQDALGRRSKKKLEAGS